VTTAWKATRERRAGLGPEGLLQVEREDGAIDDGDWGDVAEAR